MLVSIAGLMMFCWPFIVTPPSGLAHGHDAPFVFAALLPCLIAVLLAEVTGGRIDTKAIAMLGVLSAIGAALRPMGAGTAGLETVFFLLVLGGRVYGPGFGFVLGSTTLFASALLTGGVGPWLPFQMLAAAWVGLGAGLLPPARGRREIVMLAAYGAASAFAYGMLLNLWFWPFTTGTDERAVVRRRRAGGREPAPLRLVHARDVHMGLGHGPCDHERGSDPAARPGGAPDAAARGSSCRVQRAGVVCAATRSRARRMVTSSSSLSNDEK